jgi:hypothetical protein
MKTKDKLRKWMWVFLGSLAALQLYFVRELLAAFALFILGFAVIAGLIMSLYLAQKVWESGLTQLLASQNSWVMAARRGISFAEEWARRPIRRTGPEVPSNI